MYRSCNGIDQNNQNRVPMQWQVTLILVVSPNLLLE
jgi:hypothetical protein